MTASIPQTQKQEPDHEIRLLLTNLFLFLSSCSERENFPAAPVFLREVLIGAAAVRDFH
jgi:hypothetical protein